MVGVFDFCEAGRINAALSDSGSSSALVSFAKYFNTSNASEIVTEPLPITSPRRLGGLTAVVVAADVAVIAVVVVADVVVAEDVNVVVSGVGTVVTEVSLSSEVISEVISEVSEVSEVSEISEVSRNVDSDVSDVSEVSEVPVKVGVSLEVILSEVVLTGVVNVGIDTVLVVVLGGVSVPVGGVVVIGGSPDLQASQSQMVYLSESGESQFPLQRYSL